MLKAGFPDGSLRPHAASHALLALSEGDLVFVIDELDRSLHPVLSREILEYFLEKVPGVNQLIVTTHEPACWNWTCCGVMKSGMWKRIAMEDQGSTRWWNSLRDTISISAAAICRDVLVPSRCLESLQRSTTQGKTGGGKRSEKREFKPRRRKAFCGTRP
jgi:hypothetical protein